MKNILLLILFIISTNSIAAEEDYIVIHKGAVPKIYPVSEIDSITFNGLSDTLRLLLQPRKSIKTYLSYQAIYNAENGVICTDLGSLETYTPGLISQFESDTLFSYSVIDTVALEATLKIEYLGFPSGTVIGAKIDGVHWKEPEYYVRGDVNTENLALYIYRYSIYE